MTAVGGHIDIQWMLFYLSVKPGDKQIQAAGSSMMLVS